MLNTAELTRLIIRSYSKHQLDANCMLFILAVVDRGNPTKANGLFTTWKSTASFISDLPLSRSTTFRVIKGLTGSDLSPILLTKKENNNGGKESNVFTINPSWIATLSEDTTVQSDTLVVNTTVHSETPTVHSETPTVQSDTLQRFTVNPKEDNFKKIYKEDKEVEKKPTPDLLSILPFLKAYDDKQVVRNEDKYLNKGFVYTSYSAFKSGAEPVGYMADNQRVSNAVEQAKLEIGYNTTFAIEDELAAIACMH